jgi:hypothetical protein
MIQARRLLLALTIPVLLVACQKSGDPKKDDKKDDVKADDKPAPTMPSFDKDKPAADPNAFPEAGKDPIVRVLSPGKEPRKQLRFKMKAGDKQRIVMHMKIAMDMDLAGQSQKADMPTMNMVMDVTATDVAQNGDIAYEFVMSDVTVSDDGGTPGMKEAIGGILGSAKGMTGKGTISSRGFNRGAEISLPPGANPQLQQTMGQMKDAIAQIAAPVPDEPIGVGGKWEVRMSMQQQSLVIKQVGTYEITSIDGDVISTDTTVTQLADPQPVVNPQMPTLKMELVRMNGSGSGTTTFDLNKGMPVKAAAKIGNELEMAVDAGGQKQSIKMKMDLGLKIDDQL